MNEDKIIHPRIWVNPGRQMGQPCIEGTRLPVAFILWLLASGESVERILQEYPHLSREDILACNAYGATLIEQVYEVTEADLDRRAEESRATRRQASVVDIAA